MKALEGLSLAGEMAERAEDLTPVMKVIAEDLQALMLDALNAGVSPDGSKWEALAPSTVKARRRKGGGNIKALAGDTGQLRATTYAQGTKDSVLFGNRAMSKGFAYFLAQQFGATRTDTYKSKLKRYYKLKDGTKVPYEAKNKKQGAYTVITPVRAFIPLKLVGGETVPMDTGGAQVFYDATRETILKYVTDGVIE